MSPSDAVPDSILRHRPFVFYWSARTCAAFVAKKLVEPRGIEPLTSTLRTSRSPN